MDRVMDAMPAVDLPTRLEIGAPSFGEGPYADLRVESAAWIRDGGSDAFGEALETLEPLLTRSYLLGQPNLAGMGVGAWDLAVGTAAEALLSGQTARMQRMIAGTQLADLFDEEDERRDDDPDALNRGADLLTAMQTLDAAADGLPEDAPEGLRTQLETLRGDLGDRLRRERRNDRRLDTALRGRNLGQADTLAALRARAPVAPDSPAPTPMRAPRRADPYGEAIEGVLAKAPIAPSPALADLRQRIATTSEAALQAPDESPAALRLTERARRLLAEEVRLTGGAPSPGGAIDTAAIRKALASKPTRTPRPDGGPIRPKATLPEIPILSSRGEKAKVIGYLRCDEGTRALARADGFVQVPVPGRQAPGWIDAAHLADPATTARGAQLGPQPIPSFLAGEPKKKAPGGSADLARFAALVSRETGASLTELIEQIGAPILAQERAGRRPIDEEELPKKVDVDRVHIAGLGSSGNASKAMQAALAKLPERIARRTADSTATGDLPELTVSLNVRVDGDLRAEADLIADRLADAIARSGHAQVGELRIDVTRRGGVHDADPTDLLLARLANDDFDGIAETLTDERRALDATQKARLANFFGDDFGDVLVFAGPMAGALARSLDAEAVTHGQMVFFDPTHFRPDTTAGEALLAHELTHTRQDPNRDVVSKEAEAMAVESAYMSWLEPTGMHFATEIDPTAPSAMAAADVASGMRAAAGRELAEQAGPRQDTAEFEQKVGQILERVRHLLDVDTDFEGERVGALVRRMVTW
ncbi:MAG: hypothetical protein ACI9U2_003731 [Bradymonadia bacterium]|jgi:hypothetical protein